MPALLLAISLFVLSQSALLVRFAREASALEIGFWRMAVAVPLLGVIAWQGGHLGNLRRADRRTRLLIPVCGLCLFAHWWSWFLAVNQTSLANSMVFFAISPLFTAVGAWAFFREPFERRHGVAMALCFLGIFFIFRESLGFHPEHFRGDCLALLASVLFSGYVLLSKGIRRGIDNVSFTFLTYGSCGLIFAAILVAQGGIRTEYETRTWISLLLLALGPTLTGHALFTYCLQHFNVNLMSILVLTEPVLASMLAFLLISEPITQGVVAGFLTISAGVLSLFLPVLLGGRKGRT